MGKNWGVRQIADISIPASADPINLRTTGTNVITYSWEKRMHRLILRAATAGNEFQLEVSADGTNYVDLGPPLTGGTAYHIDDFASLNAPQYPYARITRPVGTNTAKLDVISKHVPSTWRED